MQKRLVIARGVKILDQKKPRGSLNSPASLRVKVKYVPRYTSNSKKVVF